MNVKLLILPSNAHKDYYRQKLTPSSDVAEIHFIYFMLTTILWTWSSIEYWSLIKEWIGLHLLHADKFLRQLAHAMVQRPFQGSSVQVREPALIENSL